LLSAKDKQRIYSLTTSKEPQGFLLGALFSYWLLFSQPGDDTPRSDQVTPHEVVVLLEHTCLMPEGSVCGIDNQMVDSLVMVAHPE
jgi:hypothetical protein